MDYIHFFEWLLITSVKASVLALVILLIKKLIGSNVGAKWHYLIWFLLIARLMLPVLPESSLSVFNHINPAIQSNNTRFVDTGYIDFNNEKSPSLNWHLIEAYLEQNMNSSEYASNTTKFNWMKAAFYIWLFISILLIIHVIIVNCLYMKKVKLNSTRSNDATKQILDYLKMKLSVKKDIRMIHSNVQSPELHGIIHPIIILPIDIENNVNRKQLEYILLHELVHFKRKDIFIVMLIKALQILHWFNPFLWYALNSIRNDNEIACDASTLSYINDNEIIQYGNTIITLIQNSLHPRNMILARLTGNRKNIKRRIIMISKYNHFSSKIRIISFALLLILTLVFLTNGKEAEADNINDKSYDNTFINENSSNNLPQPMKQADEGFNYSLIPHDIVDEANDIDVINNETEDDSIQWPLPIEGYITQGFGETKLNTFHEGVDIAAPATTDILSIEKGTIIFSGYDDEYGNYIEIQHAGDVVTKYAHCSKLLVSEGDDVIKGQVIGKVGSTGRSTGPHLHFEIIINGENIDPINDYLN